MSITTTPVISIDADWSFPVTTKIEYKTSIESSARGFESRRYRTTAPRITTEYTIHTLQDSIEILEFERDVLKYSKEPCFVPVWGSAGRIISASGGVIKIKNGLGILLTPNRPALLWNNRNNYSIITINSVNTEFGEIFVNPSYTNNNLIGAIVVPLIKCNGFAGDSDVQLYTSNNGVITIRAIEYSKEALELQELPIFAVNSNYYYNGTLIFPFDFDWGGNYGLTYQQKTTSLATDALISFDQVLNLYPSREIRTKIKLDGKDKISRFVSFFNQCKGAALKFWLPSGRSDLEIVGTPQGNTIQIKQCGYSAILYRHFSGSRRLLYIQQGNNKKILAVNSAIESGNGIETLTVSENVDGFDGKAILSFLLLARFKTDDVILSYSDSEHADAELYFVELITEYKKFGTTITYGNYLLTVSISPTIAQISTVTNISVTLKKLNNDPYPDIPIKITVSGANAFSFSENTGPGGVANFSYTGSNSGIDWIYVYADVNLNNQKDSDEPEFFGTKEYLNNTDPSIINLFVNSDPAFSYIDTQTLIEIVAKKEGGVSVGGATVKWNCSGVNNFNGSGVTDSEGYVSFSYNGTVSGDDYITIWIGEGISPYANDPQVVYSKKWINRPIVGQNISISSVVRTNSNLLPGGETVITCLTQDDNGVPLPGLSVCGQVIGVNPVPPTIFYGTTDITGKKTFSYIGANAGTDCIFCFIDSNGDKIWQNTEKRSSSYNNYYYLSNQTKFISIYNVQRAQSNSIPSPSNPVTVKIYVYSSSSGLNNIAFTWKVFGANENVTGTTGSGTTASVVGPLGSSPGYAQFQYTAQNAGWDYVKVTLTASGVTAGQLVYWSEPVPYDQISLVSITPPQSSPINTPVTIVVAVKSPAEFFPDNVPVTMIVTGSNAAIAPITALTVAGKATLTYTPTIVGSDTFTIFVDTNQNQVLDNGELLLIPAPNHSPTETTLQTLNSIVITEFTENETYPNPIYIKAKAFDNSGNTIANVNITFKLNLSLGSEPPKWNFATLASGETQRYTYYPPAVDGNIAMTLYAFYDTDGSGGISGNEISAAKSTTYIDTGALPPDPSNTFQYRVTDTTLPRALTMYEPYQDFGETFWRPWISPVVVSTSNPLWDRKVSRVVGQNLWKQTGTYPTNVKRTESTDAFYSCEITYSPTSLAWYLSIYAWGRVSGTTTYQDCEVYKGRKDTGNTPAGTYYGLQKPADADGYAGADYGALTVEQVIP